MNIEENYLLSTCIEGFLYGLYSGILVIYFQRQSNESTGRTATIVFYAICLLYVLSTVNFVTDLVTLILEARIGKGIFSLYIVQGALSGCCDFLAQCILIYRCWIVWARNIRVVIIPSFLAVAYLATWVVPPLKLTWLPLTTTSATATMAVNGLVTGLIVFRIFRVSLEIKAATTSVERTLDSTRGTKLRHIIFVIIESGMTLLVVQLVSMVFWILVPGTIAGGPEYFQIALQYFNVIIEMLNGITPTIILVRVSMKLSFDDEESLKEAVGSLCFNNPPSDPNTQRVGSMLSQDSDSEMNEDNDPPGDLNMLRQVGSSSSIQVVER